MRLIGLTCAALVMLAGCSGEPTPIEPTSTPSGANAGPPGASHESLPKPPPYVDEPSVRGRAAFAGYWIHLLNFSVNTGTTNHLEAVSSPECAACANYVDQIRVDRREGIRSTGFEWKPVSADPGSAHDVLVDVDAQAYKRVSENKDPIQVDADHYEVGFELERVGSSWRTRELYLPK